MSDQQTLDRDYLTVAQAAAYLQVTGRTIHRWIQEGVLSASQRVRGGAIRISASSIEKLLERNRK